MLTKIVLKFIWCYVFVILYFLLFGQEKQIVYTGIVTLFAAAAQILLMWSTDPKSILNRVFLFNRVLLFGTLGLATYYNQLFYFAFFNIAYYGLLAIAVYVASLKRIYLVLSPDFGYSTVLNQMVINTRDSLGQFRTISTQDVPPSIAKAANGQLFQSYLILFFLNVIILPLANRYDELWVLCAFIILPLVRWFLSVKVVNNLLFGFARSGMGAIDPANIEDALKSKLEDLQQQQPSSSDPEADLKKVQEGFKQFKKELDSFIDNVEEKVEDKLKQEVEAKKQEASSTQLVEDHPAENQPAKDQAADNQAKDDTTESKSKETSTDSKAGIESDFASYQPDASADSDPKDSKK